MPGVRPGAGPNGSVWVRAASTPNAARLALISPMNGVGPQRYAASGERRAEVGERRCDETAGTVEFAALKIARIGAAVVDVTVYVRERREERPGLCREAVLRAGGWFTR